MKLGIYGGTFSPVHNAHVKAAEAFVEKYALDKLLIIPAGIPPHKQLSGGDDPLLRFEMCNLAFSGLPKTEVSDIEIKRVGKSYTVITLRELSSPENDIYMLCGSDMVLTLDRWYCFEEIFKLCTVVYARRENDAQIEGTINEKVAEYKSKYGARVEKLDLVPLELSSTEIRTAVAAGSDISHSVPEKIEDFIKGKGLYLQEHE